MRIECRSVSKTYLTRAGVIPALADASCCISEHEFLCVVGPSGCGKTTLLKLIAGLLQPTSGEISFLGPQENGGPRCALVFQDHGLFPWMNVLDNTAFGLEMQGVDRSRRRRSAQDFIDRIGLGPFAHAFPHQLSAGMQQRVGIARAFVSHPQVLLMDEPFGSLDSQIKLILREELIRVWKEERKAVMYVTHDIEEAVLLGDRVLVMTGRPGRVRAEISVPLERPRDLTAVDRQEIKEIKWQIWNLLEDEVRKSLQIFS